MLAGTTGIENVMFDLDDMRCTFGKTFMHLVSDFQLRGSTLLKSRRMLMINYECVERHVNLRQLMQGDDKGDWTRIPFESKNYRHSDTLEAN